MFLNPPGMTKYFWLLALAVLPNGAKAETVLHDFGSFRALVTYPIGYDPTVDQKIVLGLSGGDQNQSIVEYCVDVYFTAPQLANSVVIAPINDGVGNFASRSADAYRAIFAEIDGEIPNDGNWLAVGTSNGGIAAFHAVAADPLRFDGAIVAPGALQIAPSEQWAHLRVMLAVGGEDGAWQSASDQALLALAPVVAAIGRYRFEGQGHILPRGYDIAPLYATYFALGQAQ